MGLRLYSGIQCKNNQSIIFTTHKWKHHTAVNPDGCFFFAGAGSNRQSVTFADSDPCVATGMSVVLQCSYDYPDGQTVHTAAWSKGVLTDGHWTRVDLSLLPSYQNRYKYLGDLQHDCRLDLSELKESDSGYYYFRFDTSTFGWRSRNSIHLTVTGEFFFLYLPSLLSCSALPSHPF